MKVIWLTPFARRSAIGRFSKVVCEALAARGHAVTIARTEIAEQINAELHPTALPVVVAQALHPEQVHADYDLVAVNIGDNYIFHAGAFPFLEAGGCVGILHDSYLFNLFSGYIAARGLSHEVFDRAVEQTYGLKPSERAAVFSGALDLRCASRIAPMTEWFAKRCAGAVAHADHYLPRLDAACPGPTTVIPLAWAPRRRAIRRQARAKGDVNGEVPPGPLLQVLTIGVINANKCCDRVIDAIGSRPELRARLSYRLAGPITDAERSRLQALAEVGGVRLTVLGPLEDDELEAELSGADIVMCLRSPVLEGASASAIEAMLSERPTVVCDAGFYTALPEDVVMKVDNAAAPSAIADALEQLAADPRRRRQLGEQARRYAEMTFAPDHYAEAFEGFARRCVAASPYLHLCTRIGDELGSLGVAARSPVAAGLVQRIEEMLPPGWRRRTVPYRRA